MGAGDNVNAGLHVVGEATEDAVHEAGGVVGTIGLGELDALVDGDRNLDLVDATDFSPEEEAKLDEADGTDKAKEPEPSDAPAQDDQSFGETGRAE